jgi:hypothetical protein
MNVTSLNLENTLRRKGSFIGDRLGLEYSKFHISAYKTKLEIIKCHRVTREIKSINDPICLRRLAFREWKYTLKKIKQ